METTIGLKDLYYAPITEDANGYETYGTPVKLAPAVSAAITHEFETGKLDADDRPYKRFKSLKQGKITLNVVDIEASKLCALLGAKVDGNGYIVYSDEDTAPPVAIGFRGLTSEGEYEYVWLYRVQFSVPGANYSTKKKGESLTFNSPTIEGEFVTRNKPDSKGNHPYEIHAVETEESMGDDWFSEVPEPLWPNSSNNSNSSSNT